MFPFFVPISFKYYKHIGTKTGLQASNLEPVHHIQYQLVYSLPPIKISEPLLLSDEAPPLVPLGPLGWTGLMVDGDEGHMTQVRRRFYGVTAVAAWITRENINQLILDAGFAGDVDFLSIDLDGNDYWVWEALTACSPRVVVIEYNSAFGPDRAVTIPYDAEFDRHDYRFCYYGASLAALTKLSERKGYRLVTTEPCGVNAYFLRDDV